MDRLTYFVDDNISEGLCVQVRGADNVLCKDICRKMDDCDYCPIEKAFLRLAAYEDTRLTPDQVDQIRRAAEYMMFSDTSEFVCHATNIFDELQNYKKTGLTPEQIHELKMKNEAQGHWIIKVEGSNATRRCYCSACGKRSGVGGNIKNQLKPFCPNCGVKMIMPEAKNEEQVQWIIGDGDDNFDVKCPVCGFTDIFEVCGIEMVKAIAKDMHYCQNCGARLVIPEELHD